MANLPLKEAKAMLILLSNILANGLSPDQRTEVLERFPMKTYIHDDANEYDVYGVH
jgi:hypothetical protein